MFMLLAAEGYNMFGELRAQPSRLAPDCSMDPVVGQLVASGLASAATLLCASLLRTAFKCVTSAVSVSIDHERAFLGSLTKLFCPCQAHFRATSLQRIGGW